MALKPLGDRVVVEREEAKDTTAGGIVLPDTAKDKPQKGKVVAVGDGRITKDGKRRELQVKVGEHVLFTSYAGEEFKLEGDKKVLLDARGRHPGRHRLSRVDRVSQLGAMNRTRHESSRIDPLCIGSESRMAAKMIAFDQDARQAMQRGIAKLARAVKVTLGPRGRNVIIQKSFGSPTVTKDGVTVAKEIELEDKYEDMGAKMVKEVASKTSDVAGDGTTTATVMAEAIYNEGLKAVVAGVNPMLMKRGMDKAVADIVEQLHKMSTKVTTKTETEQVATVASNFDSEIGKMIAEATEKVGKDGVITVEEGKTLKTEVEWVEGMQFDRGYLSPYFVTNPTTMEAVLEDCLHPDPREEDLGGQGPGSGARAGRADGPAALDHRRGDRGRGAGDPGDQQAAGHVPLRGGQGAGLRRPPQGHARGYRRPDRRQADLRGAGHRAGKRRRSTTWAAPRR